MCGETQTYPPSGNASVFSRPLEVVQNLSFVIPSRVKQAYGVIRLPDEFWYFVVLFRSWLSGCMQSEGFLRKLWTCA